MYGEAMKSRKRQLREVSFELLPDYIKEFHYIRTNADLGAMAVFIGLMCALFMLFILAVKP